MPRYCLNSKRQLCLVDKNKRIALDGCFACDAHNNLAYYLNQPEVWQRRYGVPNKITFLGRWELSAGNNLEFKIDKTQYPKQDRQDLAFTAQVLGAEQNKLVFQLYSTDSCGQTHWRVLRLNGSWSCNRNNQLIFQAYKSRYDQGFVFQGLWQINSSRQITYILSRSSDVKLKFAVQLETPNVYPAQGKIKFRIGLAGKRLQSNNTGILCLYGTWKFSRKLGILFDMERAGHKKQRLSFGAQVRLNNNDNIEFALLNSERNDLGITFVYSHKLLSRPDADFFLKLRQQKEDNRIEAGMRIPF